MFSNAFSSTTDQYILPKIAERDLRRFANLRSTSSKLGVRIPLDEVPLSTHTCLQFSHTSLVSFDFFLFIYLFFLSVPLQIRVSCPVSAIVKQRKVQGRECYEVFWHNIDGLKTSIVPADLIER